MQKITFSADADLLDRAEPIAKAKALLWRKKFGSGWTTSGRADGSSRLVSRGKGRPANP